jgi:hypothetical protein
MSKGELDLVTEGCADRAVGDVGKVGRGARSNFTNPVGVVEDGELLPREKRRAKLHAVVPAEVFEREKVAELAVRAGKGDCPGLLDGFGNAGFSREYRERRRAVARISLPVVAVVQLIGVGDA